MGPEGVMAFLGDLQLEPEDVMRNGALLCTIFADA
jgi:hypothetical protein